MLARIMSSTLLFIICVIALAAVAMLLIRANTRRKERAARIMRQLA